MLTSHNQVVIDHILLSRENALTAFDVHRAFPVAYRRLISNVLQQVGKRLAENCDSHVVPELNGFVESDSDWSKFIVFPVHPRGWPAGVHASFTADGWNAGIMSVGLYMEPQHQPVAEDAIHALDGLGGKKEEATKAWAWWHWLEPPYANWMQRDALERFLPPVNEPNGQARATEDLYKMLHEVIQVADPFLREVVRQ